MNRYRLHLFDQDEQIRVAHWIQARDDETAYWIAEHLYDACSDVYASFQLWHQERPVTGHDLARPRAATAAQLVEQRQQMLTFHEELLRDTACRIAESRRLLERLRGLKPI